jgi:formate-dependent nitrite reductase membrane component NrfD
VKGERRMVPKATPTSYYGQPILKEHVWKGWIPAYFFAGGLAAGLSTIAFHSDRRGRKRLARRSWVASTAALGAGTSFLIADLGRPSRFHHMLRVAKPTSPMSVGTWVLSTFGPATGLAALASVTGWLPRVGRAAGLAAAALAPAMATYTSVLLTDTAVPAWSEARGELPFVFAASAMAAAGAVAIIVTPAAEAGPARRAAVIGSLAEAAGVRVMKESLGQLAEPYHEGHAGDLSSTAETLTLGGAAVVALLGRRRIPAVMGGLLIAAGSLAERFAVVAAGSASARDPSYTVGPQKARLAARAATAF